MPSTIVAIKVNFQLITSDKKRKVIFGLQKNTEGLKVIWVINFEMFERDKKTDPWGEAIVDVDVEVQKVLHPKAETMAVQGMSANAQAHALGPAADDQKSAQAGEIPQTTADRTTQNTLKK